MTNTVGELTPNNTGQTVTIEHRQVTITGTLREVHVNQDWITEGQICQHPDDYVSVPGRRTITVTVGGWTSPDLPPNTPVVIR